MQLTLVAVAALTYLLAALEAWAVPNVGEPLKLLRTTVFPGAFLVFSVAAMLLIPALSRMLTQHLWTSYRTGFGQSVISVLVGVGVLIILSGFIFWQINDVAHGGKYPAGAFSGYAAGIGLLIAQAVLIRRIEADPTLRRQIEAE